MLQLHLCLSEEGSQQGTGMIARDAALKMGCPLPHAAHSAQGTVGMLPVPCQPALD